MQDFEIGGGEEGEVEGIVIEVGLGGEEVVIGQNLLSHCLILFASIFIAILLLPICACFVLFQYFLLIFEICIFNNL